MDRSLYDLPAEELKMEAIETHEHTLHPVEFAMYHSCCGAWVFTHPTN